MSLSEYGRFGENPVSRSGEFNPWRATRISRSALRR
jgi:hypothetical protein